MPSNFLDCANGDDLSAHEPSWIARTQTLNGRFTLCKGHYPRRLVGVFIIPRRLVGQHGEIEVGKGMTSRERHIR
jgi:hypothetical protein